jgi:hypothetical protein
LEIEKARTSAVVEEGDDNACAGKKFRGKFRHDGWGGACNPDNLYEFSFAKLNHGTLY